MLEIITAIKTDKYLDTYTYVINHLTHGKFSVDEIINAADIFINN